MAKEIPKCSIKEYPAKTEKTFRLNFSKAQNGLTNVTITGPSGAVRERITVSTGELKSAVEEL